MNLPEQFIQGMKERLGAEYSLYEESMQKESYAGIRVNNLKLTAEEFLKLNPFELEPIPWTSNGFYYQKDKQPAKHPYYFAGLYYIQEPSAMTPASYLAVEPGDRVLDLCAAPGGKSTELAAKLQGKGVLISNDISNTRAKALLKNIEMAGVKNAIVMSEEPKKMAKYFKGYFDKILIDAPCSGEGMFRKEPAMVKNWEEHRVTYYSEIQKEIVSQAVTMLRPGGLLAYSTCTFSPEENEDTIQYILNEYSDMHVTAVERYKDFDHGHPEWAQGQQSQELYNCIRLWPWRIKGEGHFLAILQKDADTETSVCKEYKKKPAKLPDEFHQFMTDVSLDWTEEQIEVMEERVYLLPKGLNDMKGLRILRSGLYLGDSKKNRFEPSQALASALKSNEYTRCIQLSSEDPRVIRYLKGETIEVEDDYENGWNLICVDGFSLGWGKLANGSVKNKYYPGWRWMA